MSEGKDMLISKSQGSLMISRTITEIERRFMRHFESLKRETLTKKPFPLSMLNFRTMDGSNIFHFLVQDYKILKRFYNSLTSHIESFDDEDEKRRQLQIYLLILYPNNHEVSPFEVAMKQSSQFVDLFLRMLADVPDYVLSKFIFKDLNIFKQLLSMNLPSFVTFLDRCLFSPLSLQQVQVRYWKHGDKDEVIAQTNTSLLTTPFLRETIGRSEHDPEEKEFLKKLQAQNKEKQGDSGVWRF